MTRLILAWPATIAMTLAANAAPAVAATEAATVPRPLAQTEEGPVLGLEREGVEAFTAIPFAAPPVGPLRFSPPQPRTHWLEPLDASREAPACPQTPGSAIGKPSEDEDCLFLNVWAPVDHAGGHRPVMVWIHGSGAKGYGGSPFFNGFHLARDNGVVVVTINYRLGLLGSLVSPSLDSANGSKKSGNYHLLDQQEALRWVRRNIATFGGDPSAVTVFGESAGGAAVLALMASPASQGLFERAIVESEGGELFVSRPVAERRVRDKVLPALGCGGAEDIAACLRSLPASAFLKLEEGLTRVEDDRLFPVDPLVAFRTGAFARVPVLIGSNAEEGHFIPQFAEQGHGRHLTESDYRAFVETNLVDFHLVSSSARALALYPSRAYSSPAAAESRLSTDLIFACPTELARRGMSAYTPVYAYEFTESDPVQEEPLSPATELPNAPYHTSEEAYVFDGDHDHAPLIGRAAALSRIMRGYWTNFARTGDPNGGDRPNWPVYDRQTQSVLDLEDTPRAAIGFWEDHKCGKLEAAGLIGATTR